MTYHLDEYADLDRSCKQGSICITYAELVAQLGEPNFEGLDTHKTRAEWRLVIDGVPIAIYDWKTFPLPLREVDVFNVGAKTMQGLFLAKGLLCSRN